MDKKKESEVQKLEEEFTLKKKDFEGKTFIFVLSFFIR